MALERTDILAAIHDSQGDISVAARKLGVARRTLQNRMRFYSIPKGQAGRRKMKISYGKKRKLYAIGGLAAAGLVGVALFRRRGTSA